MWADTLSLFMGAAILVLLFSVALILTLRQFSQLLTEACSAQAKALALLVEPLFRAPRDPVPVRDLEPAKIPEWLAEADSSDLIDPLTGRPLTWDTPVLTEEQSVGPQDLWNKPE